MKDQHLTSYTNEEVYRTSVSHLMPFKLQTRLQEQGAKFNEGTPVKENICVAESGRIVTGQNANSSINTAHALVKAYKALVSRRKSSMHV